MRKLPAWPFMVVNGVCSTAMGQALRSGPLWLLIVAGSIDLVAFVCFMRLR